MKTEPTNVRLTPETLQKIKLAAELSGEKSADVMRLAMDLGLRRLESVNYDIHRMTMNGIEAAELAGNAALSALPNPPQAKRSKTK